MRPCDDGPLEPAIAAAVWLAQRLCNGGRAICGPVHAAADRPVPQQARASHVATFAAPIVSRIECLLAAAPEVDRHAFDVGLIVVRSDGNGLASAMGYQRQSGVK